MKACNVFKGLCGAYNSLTEYKCNIFERGVKYVRGGIEDQIEHCSHRKEMNSDSGKKSIEAAIVNYFRNKK